MAKSGKRVGKTQPPRSLDQESKDSQMWWWIGGAAAVVLIGAAIIWFTAGPGQAASPTPTPAPTEPEETAAPTETTAATETAAPTEAPSTPVEAEEEGESTMPKEPGERNQMYDEPPEMQIDPSKTYVATISTEKGEIVVDLNAEEAPKTVNNFVFLAREGFYDGLTFHRVEPGFVIQGGDPTGTGTGGPGYRVPEEIGLKHVKGAIAMARLSDDVNPEKASSGSQFYITLDETPFLDGEYTVFGEVTDGMEVVEAVDVGDTIETITVEEN